MATFELLTAASPLLLRERLARDLAATTEADGACIVTPRRHFRSELVARLLPRSPRPGVFAPHVLTVQELVTHFVSQCENLTVLTRLQVRQIIATLILELDREAPGLHFPGQVIGGRVSGATLSAMARLFSELEPYRVELPPDQLEERLRTGASVGDGLSARALSIALLYRRYLSLLDGQRAAHGETIVGPLGRALRGCEQARIGALPDGLRNFLFVGLDGVGSRDVSLLLLDALRDNPAVGSVQAAIVLPESTEATAWPHHGNDGVLRYLSKSGVGGRGMRRTVLEPEVGTDDAPVGAPDLQAVAADPFAYRLPSVPAGSAVRGVRVPDTGLEIEWVAGDIKRSLLADPSLGCADVAVVVRDLQARAQDFERGLGALGIPSVSSRQTALSHVPAVRALLSLYRVAALEWRVADVVAVAESPYLPFELNPTLLARIGASGPEPRTPEEWVRRIDRAVITAEESSDPSSRRADTMPEDAVTEAVTLGRRFPLFVEFVRSVLPDTRGLSASAWVASLVTVKDRCNLHSHILNPRSQAGRAQRAQLARLDIDGLNSLWSAANDWLRGRQFARAGLVDDAPLSATEWLVELAAMADLTTVRTSTYHESAVHLVDPAQAALRRWRRVYIVGLADGMFPQRAREDEFGLSDVERRALALPTADERSARERLLFHLSAATATESLTLVTPAADDRGKALVVSPYLSGLRLRLQGFAVRSVTATSMVPTTLDEALSRSDVDLLAIGALRRAMHGAPDGLAAVRGAANADRDLLAPWLMDGAQERVVEGWGREAHRDGLDDLTRATPLAARVHEYRDFVGQLTESEVPERVKSVEATFTPSELAVYNSCHFRWYATRVLGLRAQGDGEEENDEAAAFGTLQHEILEHLYRDLDEQGVLPPTSLADIDRAVARIDTLAPQYVQKHAASAHPTLWQEDLAFVGDVLRSFVRRDLTRVYDLERGANLNEPRTRLVSLETRSGTIGRPVEMNVGGVQFRLRAQFDRVEEVDDARLPEALQGHLVVRDYKSTRRTPEAWRLLKDWMSGVNLQLPLYAAMAEQHFGGRPVFSVGILNTSQAADPTSLARRQIVAQEGGEVSLEPTMQGRTPIADALGTAIEAATTVAAGIVTAVRSGEYAPQPGRNCFGCHLSAVCRASIAPDRGHGRRRAQMPLLVEAPTP